jgi:hypothetical protein
VTSVAPGLSSRMAPASQHVVSFGYLGQGVPSKLDGSLYGHGFGWLAVNGNSWVSK